MRNRVVIAVTVLLCSLAWGQTPSSPAPATSQQSMPGMDMSAPHHDMSNMPMKDMPMGAEKDADNADANEAQGILISRASTGILRDRMSSQHRQCQRRQARSVRFTR